MTPNDLDAIRRDYERRARENMAASLAEAVCRADREAKAREILASFACAVADVMGPAEGALAASNKALMGEA